MEGLKKCKGGCKKFLSNDSFGFNNKSNEYYKQCIQCREKKLKIIREDNYEENNKDKDKDKEEMNDKKVKRESSSKISIQKHQVILKEQNYKCRGPGKNDNSEYACPMNVAGIKFCDKKSSDPEYDHIIRISDGGTNDLDNLQALCGCCHNMKTAMENIINGNNECPSKRVKTILSSLSKPKYIDYSSESEDDSD